MKISDIHVEGFGVWNGLKAEELPASMAVFFGRNEAGKTTLMQFIRAVLYGFSEERRTIYLPPVNGGSPGGALSVHDSSGRHQVWRQASAGDSPASVGRVSVVGPNGRSQGQNQLNRLVCGVDETIFNNVFAIGIRELQELGTLNDTQAAEELYNLTSGVDRVSLVDVMNDLENAQRKILPTGDQETRLTRLVERREELLREIELLQNEGKRWCEVSAEQATTRNELAKLDAEIAELERESKLIELALQAHESWQDRDAVREQLALLGPVQELPEGSLQTLGEIKRDVAEVQEAVKPLKKQQVALRREVAALPINKRLVQHSCRIDAMCEYGPWISSLERQIEGLEHDIAKAESEVLSQNKSNAPQDEDLLTLDIPSVTPEMLKSLSGPARAVKAARERSREADERQQAAKRELQNFCDQVKQEIGRDHPRNLEQLIEDAGEVVNQTRRRIQVDERLEKLKRHEKDLEAEKYDLIDKQTLPLTHVVGIAAVVLLGSVLIFVAWWNGHTTTQETTLARVFGGCVFAGMGILWKLMLDRNNANQLSAVNRQLYRVRDQLDEFEEERDELDRHLPLANGPLESRLTEAEKELKELERLLPLNDERENLAKAALEQETSFQNATQDYKESRRRWNKSLRNLGLPENLTPSQIKELSGHVNTQAQLSARVDHRVEQLEKSKEERRVLLERLRNLVEDVGVDVVASQPSAQISELAHALSSQRQLLDKKEALMSEYRELRTRSREYRDKYRGLLKSRTELFAAADVADEDEMRLRDERFKRATKLTSRLEALEGQIEAVVGDTPQEQIADLVTDVKKSELESRWKKVARRLQDSEAHRDSLNQRQGEISQALKQLSQDNQLPTLRLELNATEEQISIWGRRWQNYSLTSHLLETIRETYESERQPETLAEASQYLEQLSEGKYTRIWTPLTHNVLRVDDADGNSLSLDVLSRGTREAVFLSLRLALTAAYAKRGIQLPMILDDVLVNLDKERARSTIEVLRDFAAGGQQIFFFTCHEHIKTMFGDAEVEVRRLPSQHQINGRVEVELTALPMVNEPLPIEEPLEIEVKLEDFELPAEPEPEPEPEPEVEEPVLEAEPEPEPEPTWDDVQEENWQPSYDAVAEYERAVENELVEGSTPTTVTAVEVSTETQASEQPAEEDDSFRQSYTWESPEVWFGDDEHGDAA